MAQEELEPTVLEAELEELSRRMDRLRVLYEQYFQGVERVPPYNLQKDIVRIIHRLSQVRMRATTHKFRYQSLIQRFNAHKSYWARTMRDIEEGRLQKGAVRGERRSARLPEAVVDDAASAAESRAAADFLSQMGIATPPASPDSAPSTAEAIRGVSADEIARRAEKLRLLRAKIGGGESVAQPAPASPPAPAPASASPRPAVDPEEARTRAVFERLVETKRRLNESTDSLSFDGLRQSLQRQTEKMREKHGCRDVDFDVVVKDGKAFLKPIPR